MLSSITLEPSRVWVLGEAQGAPLARRLDQHPDAAQVEKILTTGEFWSTEGEGWVAETAK